MNAYRKTIALLVVLVVTGCALAWVSLRTPSPQCEIVIVARDMAFHVRGEDGRLVGGANPIIRLPADVVVSILLRNEDRGMSHDLVLPDVNLATRLLDYGQSQRLTFRTPGQASDSDYFCSLHPDMMRGRMRFTRSGHETIQALGVANRTGPASASSPKAITRSVFGCAADARACRDHRFHAGAGQCAAHEARSR